MTAKKYPMISIIVAIDNSNAIGRGGDLLYHLRGDMRHFKELTTGHTVVMGRRTFESLPKGALPDRRNIVITRQPCYSAPGIELASSLEEALSMSASDHVYIIGGGEVYKQTIGIADCLELTRIDAVTPDADTFFPAIDPSQWHTTSESAPLSDEKTGLRYRFLTLTRL